MLTIYLACDKDDGSMKDEPNSLQQELPNIRTVSLEDAGDIFNRLKTRYKLDKHLDMQHATNEFGKSTVDTLGVTIFTDVIKEVTIDDYTSYTMLMKFPENESTKLYNLTIEDKNGIEGMFVTKYEPTPIWLQDKSTTFEGSISNFRVNDDITAIDQDAGGAGSTNNTEYPYDCDGWVESTVTYIPVPCECDPHHPPGECDITTCHTPGFWAPITTFECFPFDIGGSNGGNQGNTSSGPGGSTTTNGPNDSEDTGSYTTIVDGEDEDATCINPPPGDLNGDCLVDIKDCLYSGTDIETCQCIANGGNETDCSNACGRLKALSDNQSVNSKLYTLKVDQGNFEKIFRADVNSSTGKYVVSPIINNNNGSNHATINVHHQSALIVHNHPDNVYYKMFSAEDILKMAQIVKRIQDYGQSTVQLTSITHIIVFENSPGDFKTYAIRMDDNQTAQILSNINSNKRSKRKFIRRLKDAYESDYSYQSYSDETDIFKQQRHLFKFLNKNNLNLSLYEANFDDNGRVDNWQKINKNTLESENCD